jgi:HSP20 family protein
MLTRDFARAGLGPSVWRDMLRLQDELNSLYSRAAEPSSATFPAVNVWTSEDSAVVTTELPGVEPNDIDISVVGETLTLRGSRGPEQLGQGDTYHRHERGHGRFSRSIQLPFRIEGDEVSATFKNGTLNITLPRAHADRPRKIQIKTA